MSGAISDIKKSKLGRPPKGGPSPAVLVRFPPGELQAVDDWSASQPDKPGRPAAIRRLVGAALKDKP